MLGKVLQITGAIIAYLCIATLVAQAAALGWMWQQGYLAEHRLWQALAAIQGVDLTKLNREEPPPVPVEQRDQLSLEEAASLRAMSVRNLELREQALAEGLQNLDVARRRLSTDKDEYGRVRDEFRAELEAMYEESLVRGREEVRLVWENLRPRQARDQIIAMIRADEMDALVQILVTMPVRKWARIAGEFRTDEEIQMLAEILRLVREGYPTAPIVTGSLEELGQPPGP